LAMEGAGCSTFGFVAVVVAIGALTFVGAGAELRLIDGTVYLLLAGPGPRVGVCVCPAFSVAAV
jgi:hypothetical protein